MVLYEGDMDAGSTVHLSPSFVVEPSFSSDWDWIDDREATEKGVVYIHTCARPM
jgi:hypothetical protein